MLVSIAQRWIKIEDITETVGIYISLNSTKQSQSIQDISCKSKKIIIPVDGREVLFDSIIWAWREKVWNDAQLSWNSKVPFISRETLETSECVKR